MKKQIERLLDAGLWPVLYMTFACWIVALYCVESYSPEYLFWHGLAALLIGVLYYCLPTVPERIYAWLSRLLNKWLVNILLVYLALHIVLHFCKRLTWNLKTDDSMDLLILCLVCVQFLFFTGDMEEENRGLLTKTVKFSGMLILCTCLMIWIGIKHPAPEAADKTNEQASTLVDDANTVSPFDWPPTRVVTVLGDVPGVPYATWQDSDVRLRDGDRLCIRAEGVVNHYGPDSEVTPDGRGRTFSHALVPDVAFISLVGRTHYGLLDDGLDASGDGLYGPGFVGSDFKTVFRNPSPEFLNPDRRLFLAVNDSMDDDNSLAFTVRIWVVRDHRVVPSPDAAESASGQSQHDTLQGNAIAGR